MSKKSNFKLTHQDPALVELISKTDHATLAKWAILCAERVIHFFEEEYPNDNRPRKALETLQTWIDTGKFSMAVIRKASLDAHAAARELPEDSPARSAARAAGQAVATAHVRTHAIGPAQYALQALSRATDEAELESVLQKERVWQYQKLKQLKESVKYTL